MSEARQRYIVSEFRHGTNPRIDAFLADIWSVCEKHQLALSHEDTHGCFEVAPISDKLHDWLIEAHDATTKNP